MLLIYTLTRDRLEYTKRMLKQLEREEVDFDHFTLDNGSTDGTQEWLAETGRMYYLNKKNEGIWKGIEKIFEFVPKHNYDLILKLDNDLEFPKQGWLKALVETYKRSDYEIISPFVEGICDGAGGAPRRGKKNGLSVVDHVGGACLLTEPSYYEKEMVYGNKAQGWDTWFCKNRLCGIVEGIHVKHDTVKQEATMPDYYKRKCKEANER